jgi:hypothetical protein
MRRGAIEIIVVGAAAAALMAPTPLGAAPPTAPAVGAATPQAPAAAATDKTRMLAAVPALTRTADAMVDAAREFLAALPADLRPRGQHPFVAPDRTSFKYVPMARSGVSLKALNAEGRKLVHALLKTGLAHVGYEKATQIIALEPVLAAIENNPVRRDPENYYVWIFGEPTRKGPWSWKFEGHHLSLNFTVAGGTITSVPAFFGANPAEVRSGPKQGLRILHAEEDLGRALLLSFPENRRAEVVFDDEAPNEIFTADLSLAAPLPDLGMPTAKMTAPQRELVRRLLAEYAGALPAPLAKVRLDRIEASGFDKLRFAWAGSAERGKPHYYRLSGPTFVIEYDNTQNGNHVHSVWRDFQRDFGRDLLREHLEADHGVSRKAPR